MVFPMHVQDPKKTIRLSPPQKKTIHEPQLKPYGHPPSLLLAEANVAIGLLGCASLSAYSR